MRVAFCAFGVSAQLAARAEFYRQDLELLRSLGHDVHHVGSPSELTGRYDLAFVWWWNYLCLWAPVFFLRRTPMIVTGVYDLEATSRMPFYKRLLKSAFAGSANQNLFVSELEATEVAAHLRLSPDRVLSAPLVVDSAVYRPAEKKRNDRYLLLNVAWQRATNMKRKQLPELLTAFAKFVESVPNARLVMAGSPEDGGALLQQQAQELRIDHLVDFPGEITRDEKVRLMQQCDLYCQVSSFEGFGLAVAEAMACGAPVLVSRNGAVPEVVKSFGYYVEPTVQGITDGLIQSWRHPEVAQQRAERAQFAQQEFSSSRRSAVISEAIRRAVRD